MALARCANHPPSGRGTKTYSTTPHSPVGHPMSGVICGRQHCRSVALVWLTQEEEVEFQNGEYIFRLDTHTVKVAVQNSPVSS